MPGDAPPAAEMPHYCPYCGEPVGSFFGRFAADGAVWCERCQSWFRAHRCDEPDGEDAE
jgi:hypothetical protein